MPDPVQVTIGDITATLQPVGITRAAGLAIDVEDPRAKDPSYVLAVSAACLRAAWPEDVKWPARKRPRKHKLGSDVADYGEAVLDELYPASGMTLAALGEQLAKARAWVVVSAVTEQEVSTAADFSQDREDSAD